MKIKVYPSSFSGICPIPPSKSHTLRALLFAAKATSASTLKNVLPSPDTDAMIKGLEKMGTHIDYNPALATANVYPQATQPIADPKLIDAGNSGLVLRLLPPLCAIGSQPFIFTGDHSIRHQRPVYPLLSGIKQLGGRAACLFSNDKAPFVVSGPISPGFATLCGADSQPISGLMIASAFLDAKTTLFVDNPSEKPWIDLTLHWLHRLGAKIHNDNYTYYEIEGNLSYPGFTYTVPADFSSAAFPLAAAVIGCGPLTLTGLDFTDCQGDKQLFDILKSMGAKQHDACTFIPSTLQGTCIDVSPIIDALPILAVIGCYAKGQTTLMNATMARYKESNRLEAIAHELKKMGAQISVQDDSLTIQHSSLSGAELETYNDHRIALALIVAALRASSPSVLDAGCIIKTYPSFISNLQALGARICLI